MISVFVNCALIQESEACLSGFVLGIPCLLGVCVYLLSMCVYHEREDTVDSSTSALVLST